MTAMSMALTGDNGIQVVLMLFIMLAAAKILAELFERLRQPAVVGEILAGVIIGPSLLGWVSPSAITNTLAEIGVIFLLFGVGLETMPKSISKIGARATVVAVLGVFLPFVGGFLLMHWWGAPNLEALFIGTAMVATSVGITARVLGAMKVLEARTSRIILGAAVIDDILGLIILAMVSGTSAGRLNYLVIGTTAVMAIVFAALVLFVGAPAVKRLTPRIENLRASESLFIFGLLLCLGLSVAASYVGIAAIIGAFLAGMALAEPTEGHPTMHKQISGVTEFLVPFFLVNIGMQVRLEVFRSPSVLLLTGAITLMAVATKLIGCGLGALSLGWRPSLQVGMGMVPRGEVGIVVAQIGLSLAVINEELFGAVLFMAVATTLIAPPFLKILFSPDTAELRDPD